MDNEKRKQKFIYKLEAEKPGEYVLLSEYMGADKPLTAQHKCGHIRTVAEARDLIRKDCPICKRAECAVDRADKRWTEHFSRIEEMGFTALEAYNGYRTKIKWRCNVCGAVIERTPEDVLCRGMKCNHGSNADDELRRLRKEQIKILRKIEAVKQQEYRRSERQKEFMELCRWYEENGYTVMEVKEDLSGAILRHNLCGREYFARKDCMKKRHGCAACARCGTSMGVQQIERLLDSHGIHYEREVTFSSCRRINPLPFDFVIMRGSNIKALIEYNGEQHYRARPMFGGEEKLQRVQEADEIKKEWAASRGIQLFVIKYNDDIEDRIKELLEALKMERED